MKSLEELMQQVHSRGLLINNLFQLDERRWQANVTDQSRYWEFGHGATPQEALSQALYKTDTTKPELVTDRPVRATQEYRDRGPTIIGNVADVVLNPDRKFEL